MAFKKSLIKKLREGEIIGVLPTDTIYGLVGSALSEKAVLRIYRLRKRTPTKPMIILIGSLRQIDLFGIKPDRKTGKILKKYWPDKVSIILSCRLKKFLYLHRGTKSLAFRLPNNVWLQKLLLKTGPLVAPSANIEGASPAKTIKEAKKYFGKSVDFYIDAGKLESLASTLISVKNGKLLVLREGAVKI